MLNVLVRFQNRAVLVLPRHRVLVQLLRKRGGVGHIFGDGRDLGRPAREDVGVLFGGRLGGRLAVVRGRRTVRDVLVRLEQRAVLVLPRHREFLLLPLGVEGGVLGQINSRTIRIGVASTIGRRIPVQEVVAFAGERVGSQCGIGLRIYGLRGHRTLDWVFRISVGFKGDGQLDRRSTAPDAIDIVDGVASLGVLRLGVGVVGVVQLGGGDGDGHRLIPVRIILIGCGLLAGCALLNVLAGAVAGADVRTALGGVDGANSRYAAVYINLSVFKVCICAVVHLARRIGHGLKLAGAPDKVVGVPLIAVVNIYIFAVCNRQASAFGNIDLNARQQSCILIDGHIAGLNIDGDVVGDGQFVACRVDTHARKL